jgi:hypothetical protein
MRADGAGSFPLIDERGRDSKGVAEGMHALSVCRFKAPSLRFKSRC